MSLAGTIMNDHFKVGNFLEGVIIAHTWFSVWEKHKSFRLIMIVMQKQMPFCKTLRHIWSWCLCLILWLCDNSYEYCTYRWTHSSSIGLILVSITTILTSIVTIFACIELGIFGKQNLRTIIKWTRNVILHHNQGTLDYIRTLK